MVGGIRFGGIGAGAVTRAPSSAGSGRARLTSNVNLVGGKTFTATSLAELIKKSGNKVLTLLPGQKVTLKNLDSSLANRVVGRNSNSPLTVTPSRDINGARIEIKANAKPGSDTISLETYELGTKLKLKTRVTFKVSVLPRGA